jgi:hypothetical protein
MSSPDVVPERFRAGRELSSVTRNITVRESKRPKARVQDHDYKRRSSVSPSMRPMSAIGYAHESSMREANTDHSRGDVSRGAFGIGLNPDVGNTKHNSDAGHGATNYRDSWTGPGPVNVAGGISANTHPNHPTLASDQALVPEDFEISLTYEGALQRHRVTQHMFVSQLAEEAATIFHLFAGDLVLLLFGMVPHMLSRLNRISDPP